MAVLEIRNAAGDRSLQPLSEKLPLTIGRHSSNDIVVDEDGVATMHCRIQWMKSKYQVTAANSAGVAVNGGLTPQADLKEGDVIRVGSWEIRYREANSAESLEEDIPLMHEEDSRVPEWEHPSRRQAKGREPQEVGGGERRGKRGDEHPPALKDSLAELFSDVEDEEAGSFSPGGGRHGGEDDYGDVPADSLAEILDETPFEAKEEKPRGPQPINTPADLFNKRPRRPQEKDAVRSPLVLFLGGGMLVLLLAAGTLWFLIGRQGAQQMYSRALAEYDQKRYTSAIERFDEFLKSYPRHGMSQTARSYIGLAKIEQALVGTAPDWKKGLEQLDQYIRAERQKPSFPDWQARVREIAEHISFGSLETAVVSHDSSHLDQSASAAKVLELNSPLDSPPTETLRKIHDATLAAQAAILKYQVITKAYADIDAAVGGGETQKGLQLHRKLLDQYADAEGLPEMKERLKQILEGEQKQIARTEPDRVAKTEERPGHLPSIRVARQTRARADLKPSGINTFAMAEGTCLAVDSGTGAIQWDRQLGIRQPFVPVPVSTDVAALLAFDTRHQDLLLLRQKDGKLLWRQPLGEEILGRPLVHTGNVFVATGAGHLHQLDLGSGKLLATLKFPQAIVGPPVLTAHDERLVVVGREKVIYFLNYRPLNGLGVVYTQHRGGSIQAPPIKMGSYVLLSEIDRKDSTKISVWNFAGEVPQAAVASERVPGLVRDTPLLRGKLLCVPSSGQQVTVFSVSDEPAQPILKRVAGYQVPRGGAGAIYLAAGPEDELWMAGQSVRRLRLTRDSIVPDERQVALGAATQPLRVIDQDLIAGGYLGNSRATTVIAADRRQMVGLWQTVTAMVPRWVATVGNDGARMRTLTDTGDLFEIGVPKGTKGEYAPARLLSSLPDGESGRTGMLVCAVGNGQRAFMAAGGKKPHWWQIDREGVFVSEGDLQAALEIAPTPFAGGVLLPTAGKLSYLDLQNPDRKVEDFISAVAEGQKPAAWTAVRSVSATEALAVTKTGRLARFQLRSDPQAHLFEVTHLELKSAVNFAPLMLGDRVLVGTKNQLQKRQLETWEVEQSVDLPGEISSVPWRVGTRVLVEVEDRLLVVLDEKLKPAGEFPLESRVAGAPVAWNGAIVVPLQAGRLMKIQEDGKSSLHAVDRNLAGDPVVAGKMLMLPAVDGSWLGLDALPEVQKP